MCDRGVVDVGGVHELRLAADALELSLPGPVDESRGQVRVARSPDEVRTQRDGREARAVRGQDRLFGESFRMRVAGQELRRVRLRLVDAVLIGPSERHARRTGEDELADAELPTRGDDVPRADDVGLVVVSPPAPHAGLGRGVEDDVAPPGGRLDRGGVGKVAEDLIHAERIKRRVGAAGEGTDRVAAFAEHADDGPAEEPAAAGDQGPHRAASAGCRSGGMRTQAISPSTHSRSFSRKILELCRTSTGKSCGYSRKTSIPRVCSYRRAASRRSRSMSAEGRLGYPSS